MIVCLTGGIGSGKSVVANIFESLGAIIFNSDEVAKDLYFKENIRIQVIQLLGSKAYQTDGSLNKTFINNSIFSDKNLLLQLNAIIHPAVIQKFNEIVQLHPKKILVKETALLFEVNLEKNCDTIIVVASDDKLRINRVMQRDQLSELEVQKKINNQLPQQEKIARANYVIYNNEKDLLIPQVLKLYELFLMS